MNYKITFVIPLHRMHLKIFDETFESLLNAKIKEIDYNFIIVLNGHTSKNIHSKYLDNPEKDNIKLIKYDDEKSVPGARNIGFKFVDTKTVIFLDADIIVPKYFFKHLKKYLSLLDQKSYIGGLCPLLAVNKNIESGLQKYENLEGIRSVNSYKRKKYIKLFGGFCIVIKSSVFKEIGGFDESFICSEDRELAASVYEAGYKILCMPDIEMVHVDPSSYKNIIKRKRWHAIGNAQLAIKHPGDFDGSYLEWILLLFGKPFQLAPFDIYSYLYYWFIMPLYTIYFIYYKYRFKHGFVKTDRK